MAILRKMTTGAAILYLLTAMTFSSVLPVAAQWRETIGVFRIGIVDEDRAPGSTMKYEPFREAVSFALDMEVELFQASTTGQLIDALSSDRIEYALLSASGYALGAVLCECIEPLVIPKASDSTDSYHLVALAENNSKVTLENLSGQRVGIISQDAISGKPLVEYLLANQERPVELSGVQTVSLPTSHETREAFLRGEMDILFGWSSLTGFPNEGYSRGTIRQLMESPQNGGKRFKILWRSGDLAHRPHVVRKKLPGELKNLLRRVMIGLYENNPAAYDAIEPVYGGGFSSGSADRYDPLIRFFSDLKSKRAIQTAPPSREPETE